MCRLDREPDVAWWQSEEFFIPYRCPTDNRIHRYFCDFLVGMKDGRTLLIEVKPKKQTMAPKRPAKQTKRFINECLTYAKNQAKWKAAEEWCAARGYQFLIFTEVELGIKTHG